MQTPGQDRIVGRDEPLRRLGAAFDVAALGHRSAVLVTGQAGMGKTSLLAAAIAAGAPDGAIVGWGTCWHGEGAPGFWPWMQAMGGLARAVGGAATADAAGGDREVLATFVRDLGPPVETSGDPERHRLLLLDVAVRWIEALAVDRHVLVVLDDLQWADESSLDLLDHLVAAPAAVPLSVFGAYRHDELDRDRRVRMAKLESHLECVHLEGLDVAGVEQLVGSLAGEDIGRSRGPELHRRTGGHPLFVRELASLPELGTGGALPTVITGAVERRLDVLPAASRAVLEVGSVLGNRLLPDVLGYVTDVPTPDVVGLLQTAVDAGLVDRSPDGELWFVHDLFRETLYGGLDVADRVRFHHRIGEALEAREARGASVPSGDIARHLMAGIAEGPPDRAIRWARQAAADDQRRSAFTEAANHLQRVRTATLDAGWTIGPDVLFDLLVEEADARARSGKPDVARSLLAEADRVAPGPHGRADVALAVQRLGARFAVPRAAIVAQLEAALGAGADLDGSRRAQLTAALSRELQHSVADDRSRALPLSEEALALGRASQDEHALVACLLARHDALWTPGTGDARAEIGREIAAVGERLGDVDRHAEGLLLWANGLLEAGSPGFRPVLDRWFGVIESRNEPRDRYMVLTRRAALALLEGTDGDAESLMFDAARVGEQIHEPDTGNVLMSQRVALARVRNDPEELEVLASDAVRWWTGAPVLARAVAARACAVAGSLDSSARHVAVLEEAGGWRSEGSYLRSVLVAHLAEAAVALGDVELCKDLLADVEDLVGSCGVNGALVAFAGPFAHTAGVLAAALGDVRGAAALLDQSIETSDRLGAVVWLRNGTDARQALDVPATDVGRQDTASPRFVREDRVWTLSWHHEQVSLPHAKGLADLAVLLQRPGRSVSALVLAGGVAAAGSNDPLIDLQALSAYRTRLSELDAELDRARDDADIGRIEVLEHERDRLLEEVRRATGIGGRLRPSTNDPAERARKAVSARIRDTIGRIGQVAPTLGLHLDRSIQTGLECTYQPPPGDGPAPRWIIDA
jgi:hypothetical protein